MITRATYLYIVKLLDDGLNVNFISRFCNVDVEIVQGIVDRTYVPDPEPALIRKRKPAALPIPKASRLIPVTRPFPDLTTMNDRERVIALTRHGLAAAKIQRHLANPHSIKWINKYATEVLGPRRIGVNNSRANQITSTDMPYVLEALRRLGKDRYQCELCLERVPTGCVVHHTKYEGATVYDLMFVCGSCNRSRENVGLS